ncbi:MAG: DUF4407 domain-containing protein [Ferruginibacter sp.]
MEKNIAFSQRENYVPSQLTELLWWLSTAEKEILVDSVVDRNRYRIIGMTVLGTWLFATFTWTYFFSTLVDSIIISALLGIFMGFIILTIDRALIKGITKYNKKKFTPLLFRGLLALTIGTFMAQPAVLYMFDKEIKMQTSLDNEARKITKRNSLDSLYSNQKQNLLKDKMVLQTEVANSFAVVEKARQDYISESDGSGGTGKVGIAAIAMAKKTEYQKLDTAYQVLLSANSKKIVSIDSTLQQITSNIKKDEASFAQYLNNGFLTRIEALNNLLKNNGALQFRYYLIVFILMLIELMPVIAKTMLPSGSYDEKVLLRENLEIEMANSNINQEKELKMLYNHMAMENDKEAIAAFFSLTKEDRFDKIKILSKKWKDGDQQSFDGFWENMKKNILTKQEN